MVTPTAIIKASLRSDLSRVRNSKLSILIRPYYYTNFQNSVISHIITPDHNLLNFKNKFMEKPKKENSSETASNEGQITEGEIGKYDSQHFKEKLAAILPEGTTAEQVMVFHGPKGWIWRLKSEFVKDPEKKRQYKVEEEAWPA